MKVKSIAFIKLPFVIKIFVLFIFRGPFTQVLLYIKFNAHLPNHHLIMFLINRQVQDHHPYQWE